MAKKNIVLIKLVSSADTGFYYVAQKNPKKQTEKLAFKKYDPVVRKSEALDIRSGWRAAHHHD